MQTPVNKNATKEAKKLLSYLETISGKKIITGQHTQTNPMEEVEYIKSLTGKKPKYVAQLQSQFHIMSTQQDCLVHIMCQTAQQAHGLYSGWIIEEGRGFIQQDERCLLCHDQGSLTFTYWSEEIYNSRA